MRNAIRVPLMVLLGLMLAPTTEAGTVRASIAIKGNPPVTMIREVGLPVPQSVAWRDAEGRICKAVMNVEDMGEKVFVGITAHCARERGEPASVVHGKLLVAWNDHGVMRIAGEDSQREFTESDVPVVSFDVFTVSEGQVEPSSGGVHLGLIAMKGRSHYSWAVPRAGAMRVTCPEPVVLKDKPGLVVGEIVGRYRPGDQLMVECTESLADGSEQPVDLELVFF